MGRRCWRGPCAGALSRRRWASALIQRNSALGAADVAERHGVGREQLEHRRPGRGSTIRPASTPCTSRPSPRSPAGPAPSSCGCARSRSRPAPRKPMRRRLPSGSVASMPPLSSAAVDLLEHAVERRRNEPRKPPAAGREARGPRAPDARRAWSCRRSYELEGGLSSADEESRARRAARLEEALVGQIGTAVLLVRPSACATRTGRRGRACRASRPPQGAGRRG